MKHFFRRFSSFIITVVLLAFISENIGIYTWLMFSREMCRISYTPYTDKTTSHTKIIVPDQCNPGEYIRLSDDEILWKGRLYDILDESVQQEHTVFIAYLDAEEEDILEKLNHYFSGSTDSKIPLKKKSGHSANDYKMLSQLPGLFFPELNPLQSLSHLQMIPTCIAVSRFLTPPPES